MYICIYMYYCTYHFQATLIEDATSPSEAQGDKSTMQQTTKRFYKSRLTPIDIVSLKYQWSNSIENNRHTQVSIKGPEIIISLKTYLFNHQTGGAFFDSFPMPIPKQWRYKQEVSCQFPMPCERLPLVPCNQRCDHVCGRISTNNA